MNDIDRRVFIEFIAPIGCLVVPLICVGIMCIVAGVLA